MFYLIDINLLRFCTINNTVIWNKNYEHFTGNWSFNVSFTCLTIFIRCSIVFFYSFTFLENKRDYFLNWKFVSMVIEKNERDAPRIPYASRNVQLTWRYYNHYLLPTSTRARHLHISRQFVELKMIASCCYLMGINPAKIGIAAWHPLIKFKSTGNYSPTCSDNDEYLKLAVAKDLICLELRAWFAAAGVGGLYQYDGPGKFFFWYLLVRLHWHCSIKNISK